MAEFGENCGNDTIAESTSTYNGKRRLTSAVWKGYDRIFKADGSVEAKCRYCKKSLVGSSKSGTTHLRKHLDICVFLKRAKTNQPDVKQLILKMAKKEEASSVQPLNFDQDLSQNELARMIILHELPLHIVEHQGFRSFVMSIQPMFRIASTNTMKFECLNIFDNEKRKLFDLLDKLSARVSLSADLWNSTLNVVYICLTAHFIDEDWTLQKRILNFCDLKDPEAGELIAQCITEKLFDWNIDSKLFGIVLDDGSTNDVLAREMVMKLAGKDSLLLGGDMFQVHCFMHVLNMLVQDSLDAIPEVIHKVRESIKYIKFSQMAQQKFNEVAREVQASQKLVDLDVPMKWNTTYLMLATVLEFKDAFSLLSERDDSYKHAPSLEEWEYIGVVCSCLKIFYEIAQVFLETKYPTSNLYFAEACGIHLLLNEWYKSPFSFLVSMASNMMEKFQKYWGSTRIILAIAAILDPQLKMKSLEYYFPLIYGTSGEMRTAEIRNGLTNLYSEYMARSMRTSLDRELPEKVGSRGYDGNNDCGVKRSGGVTSSCSSTHDWRQGFDNFSQETSAAQQRKSDLEIYLEEPVYLVEKGLDENLDILAWWKLNSFKYPIVAQMAHDILAIPMSCALSESVFRIGSRVLDQYRSSLDPSILETLICAQDWLKNEGKDDSSNGQPNICTLNTMVDGDYEDD